MNPWLRPLHLLLVVLVLSVGVGCSTLTGEDDDDDDDISRDDTIGRTSRTDDIPNNDNPSGIPSSANMIREADGRNINFRAPHEGTVYVYDDDDNRLVYQTRMRDGARFQLNADDRRIMIDGDAVNDRNLETDLARNHRYQVYFDRDR